MRNPLAGCRWLAPFSGLVYWNDGAHPAEVKTQVAVGKPGKPQRHTEVILLKEVRCDCAHCTEVIAHSAAHQAGKGESAIEMDPVKRLIIRILCKPVFDVHLYGYFDVMECDGEIGWVALNQFILSAPLYIQELYAGFYLLFKAYAASCPPHESEFVVSSGCITIYL